MIFFQHDTVKEKMHTIQIAFTEIYHLDMLLVTGMVCLRYFYYALFNVIIFILSLQNNDFQNLMQASFMYLV